jgi:PAS domain S-box-containing protein
MRAQNGTLLLHLFGLVAIALLPAIAVQAYNEFELRQTRQVEVQEQALYLADHAAADQMQIIQGIHQALIALSELPAIKTKDALQCDDYLSKIKKHYPGFVVFIAVDLSGNAVCGSSQSSAVGRAYFDSALQSGKFTIGEFAVGRTTGSHVLHFALPSYSDDSQMTGVVIAALSLDWLAEHIAQKGVRPGSALTITDRNGTILARYPDNNRFVGKNVRGGIDDRGALDRLDIDGGKRIVGSSVLGDDFGGLHVYYGVDKQQAFRGIERRTLIDIFLIALSTSLVLVMTWLGARRFIRQPLAQLVAAANRWRLGELDGRVDICGKSEIAQVASAFNKMADTLALRERELSEATVKAEEAAARITLIFESTTDSVLMVDRNWHITYLNGPAWDEFADRNLVGRNLLEAFHDSVELGVFDQLRGALAEQRPAFVEVFCTRRGVWHAVNAFPSSRGLAIFVRDITEHKHAVEAQRLMQEQLYQSQKMETVGRLTGGIAHDFNNLLMVISANLELIELEENEKIRQFSALARRAADSGSKLTSQLLAFSRRQTLNPKLINATKLIDEFQGLIRQAVGRGCDMRLKMEEQLWLSYVDPTLLETALLNLALNGRDAMPNGGILQIETRNVFLKDGTADGYLPGPYVRLAVSDTGCGIPAEIRKRVFEPFFTTKGIGKGTGLGLSMVYGFVQQSGGHVAIESTPGMGTTVAIYLPKANQENASKAEPTVAQTITRGSERILVVEDNEDILEATSALLTTLGYQVLRARNGAEALRIIDDEEGIQLLFSDIVLPGGLNGIELAREAKRFNKSIKVLLTSGYAGDVLEQNGGNDEFPILAKPFRREGLIRSVRSVLDADDVAPMRA